MTAPSTGSVSRDTSGCSACIQPGYQCHWRNDMSIHEWPISIREHSTCKLMALHFCCTACEDASSPTGPKAGHHLHYGCCCNYGVPCQMRLPCMASLAPHHGVEPGAGCHERSCLQLDRNVSGPAVAEEWAPPAVERVLAEVVYNAMCLSQHPFLLMQAGQAEALPSRGPHHSSLHSSDVRKSRPPGST